MKLERRDLIKMAVGVPLAATMPQTKRYVPWHKIETPVTIRLGLLLQIAEKIQRVPLYLASVDHTDKNPSMVAARNCASRAYQELSAILQKHQNEQINRRDG